MNTYVLERFDKKGEKFRENSWQRFVKKIDRRKRREDEGKKMKTSEKCWEVREERRSNAKKRNLNEIEKKLYELELAAEYRQLLICAAG